MDDFALDSVDDVMRHTPGITVSAYDTDRSNYHSRGFSINNFQYDGIPSAVRNVAYSAGNTLSDMAIYDRVEVTQRRLWPAQRRRFPGRHHQPGTQETHIGIPRPYHHSGGHLGSLPHGSGRQRPTDRNRQCARAGGSGISGQQVPRSTATPTKAQCSTASSNSIYRPTPCSPWAPIIRTANPKVRPRPAVSPLFNYSGALNDAKRSFSNATDWSSWQQYTRTVFANLEHDLGDGWVTKLQLDHKLNGYDAQMGAIQFSPAGSGWHCRH